MDTFYYTSSEKLHDIFLSINVARFLYRGRDSFEEFLNTSVERFLQDDCDGTIELKNENGKSVGYGNFKRYGYIFDDQIFVLEEFYDKAVFFSYGTDTDDLVRKELEEFQRQQIEEDYDLLYNKAFSFAEKVHKGQKDKGGEPYINHPLFVSEHVEGKPEKIVAILHDVIEDSDQEISDLGAIFPKTIIDAVSALTRKNNESYLDYIIRLRLNPVARKVKIEDMKHNMDLRRLVEIKENDKKRLEKYRKYLKLLEEDYFFKDLILDIPIDDLRMVQYQWEGYEFHKALRYIADADKKKLWKSIEVVNMLQKMNADSTTIIAALLYCNVEMEKLNPELFTRIQ